MQQALARYILQLADAAARTRTATDRPVYGDYLAEAAVLLARAVGGASSADLEPLLQGHERTRGHTWLQGPEHQTVSDAWQGVLAHAAALRAT